MEERYYKVIKANFLRPVGTILELHPKTEHTNYGYYCPVNHEDVMYNLEEYKRLSADDDNDCEVITQYIVENSAEYFVPVEKIVTYKE